MTPLPDDITRTDAWQALSRHADDMRGVRITDLLEGEIGRMERMVFTYDHVWVDLSRHLASAQTMDLLHALARQQNTMHWFERMCAGEAVNVTEGRAAHHTLLRDPAAPPEIRDVLARMKALAEHIHKTGIRDIVHIGIGGSDLGPRLAYDVLKGGLYPNVHFVSNIDAADLDAVLENLNPKTTWLSVASKTFSTQETIVNLKAAMQWLGPYKNQVVALTANTLEAALYGIHEDHILPMWDWVGGRFSLWSSVGFPIIVGCGYNAFIEMLDGAHAMDRHALSAPPERNIPLNMALLGIWYRNFMGASAHAVLPYAQRLARLPDYLQQLEMESNGKSVTRDGTPCRHATAPVIFGQPGTGGQHAFYQMLHQGLDLIPCDFIGTIASGGDRADALQAHKMLNANMLAQSRALMLGDDTPDAPQKACPGNRPSTTIVLPRLNASALGFLLALYEHKTVMQGFTWGINPFDQYGVELGKRLAKDLLAPPAEVTHNLGEDHSTRKLYFHIFNPHWERS